MKKEPEILLFPTDTVPGIGCFLSEGCIEKLRKIKNRPPEKPFAIILSDTEDINDYVIEVPEILNKLEMFFPGKMTLIFKAKENLPDGVVSEDNRIGIRVPDLEILREIIREKGKPLVGTSANLSGSPAPDSIEDVNVEYDRIIPGESGGGKPSTVLDIVPEPPVLLRKGAIFIPEIEEEIGKEILLDNGVELNILFVCSANMCRSPMAASHLKSLTENLEPSINIRSAGTRALSGSPVSIGARRILESNNLDDQHLAVSVKPVIIDWADLIFVMEKRHRDYIEKISPGSSKKIRFLRNFKDPSLPGEIEDPVGHGKEFYEKVFNTITESNRRLFAYLKRKYGIK